MGDPGSIPESGISPGERNGNLLQYFYLENPKDRGTWWAAVCGVADLATKPSPEQLNSKHGSENHSYNDGKCEVQFVWSSRVMI